MRLQEAVQCHLHHPPPTYAEVSTASSRLCIGAALWRPASTWTTSEALLLLPQLGPHLAQDKLPARLLMSQHPAQSLGRTSTRPPSSHSKESPLSPHSAGVTLPLSTKAALLVRAGPSVSSGCLKKHHRLGGLNNRS